MLRFNKWAVLAIAHLVVITCLAVGVFVLAFRVDKRLEGNLTVSSKPPSAAEIQRFNLLCDQIDVIENNLANADTMAFKRQRVNVEEGTPPRMSANQLDMTQGSLESTGSPLDVAIQGDGFFRVQIKPDVSDGTAFTRNGALCRNRDGRLVVGIGSGYPLLPAITIPVGATDISVGQDGKVSYRPAKGTSSVSAGQIWMAQFTHPEALRKQDGLYLPSLDSGDPVLGSPGENGMGVLIQGFMEESNVNPHKEWAALVRAQKLLDLNSPALTPAVKMKVGTAPRHPSAPGSAGV